MSGYRDDEELLKLDPLTLGYTSVKLGLGLFSIGLGLLVTGHLIFAVVAVLVGVPLLRYGLRNP